MNWLDQADVSPQLLGFTEGNGFWSLLGTGCCLATSLGLTESTNVKMFLRIYKLQPLGPSVCVPRVLTWWQREAYSLFSAVRWKRELMDWTHHTTSLRLDEAHFSLQPPPLRVASRCCLIWPLLLFPPGSHSTCCLRAGPWSSRASTSTSGSQALGFTCSCCWDPFSPRSSQACALTSDRGLLSGHVLRGSTTTQSVVPPARTLSFTLWLPDSWYIS